ncbi:MAG TPA: beta-ketoacyl-ACP synthase II [Candidatus Cryptobacteroides excrementigallinarum]|nr:beta-ketoacyl-ACP synthase II [Candidatus Cryptobacteroides excrementigallinarum]
MRHRVVVTGMGVISPVGNDVRTFWDSLVHGVNGIGFISEFPTEELPVKIAGMVRNFDGVALGLDKAFVRKQDKFAQYGMAAAIQAMEQSGLRAEGEDANIDPFRLGVYVGSGVGGFETQYRETEKMIGDPSGRWVSPMMVPTIISNMAAGQIAIRFHANGPCIDVVTACATSTNALGEAFRAIRHGYADAVIAGGCEHMTTPLGIAGFANAKALSRAEDPEYASLPFSADRKGFVMGDGAAVLVLEELEHALARGARIYGEMVGYGNTCDAYHATAPRPDGVTQSRCIIDALREAGYDESEDALYINAHGTGTKLNDSAETLACKLALGDAAYKAHITSIKSMTGHMFGAAGAAEAIATLMTLNEGIVTPTINLTAPDPECDLDYTPCEAVSCNVTLGISNSFGFGGHNACIAFRKYR